MEPLLALAAFVFVVSITPGPNNLMLAASGVGCGLALFQFANPKGWLAGITMVSAFLPSLGSGWSALALLCLVACVVNVPCIWSWALLGATIRARLNDPRWRRGFSATMVVLTLYTALAIWL